MNTAIRDWLKSSKWGVKAAYALRGIRTIDSLTELDTFLDDVLARHPHLDDKGVRELGSICFRPKNRRLPDDPFSEAYREEQRQLYFEVSGRARYDVGFESAEFDLEKEKRDFFPYNTRSSVMVGNQLVTQGMIVRNIDLAPGSRIVEFGAGSGNVTLQLALTGYAMTAVEVGCQALELIRHRAVIHGREIDLVNQDMVGFARTSPSEQYDAALFVASFHHCNDHLALLEQLGRILKPGGLIYFADEPVHLAENQALPYPWGLRLDGQSIFFIRKHGWLELGFQNAYLERALARFGWKLSKKRSPLAGFPNFLIGHR